MMFGIRIKLKKELKSSNDKIFLQRISEYRKHRLWLLKNATKNIGNSEALRSYVIRIIIGMY